MPAPTNQPDNKIRGNAPEWATTEEQQDYWNRKERQQQRIEQLVECVDAFTVFLADINEAISKLRKEFERLNTK